MITNVEQCQGSLAGRTSAEVVVENGEHSRLAQDGKGGPTKNDENVGDYQG